MIGCRHMLANKLPLLGEHGRKHAFTHFVTVTLHSISGFVMLPTASTGTVLKHGHQPLPALFPLVQQRHIASIFRQTNPAHPQWIPPTMWYASIDNRCLCHMAQRGSSTDSDLLPLVTRHRENSRTFQNGTLTCQAHNEGTTLRYSPQKHHRDTAGTCVQHAVHQTATGRLGSVGRHPDLLRQ